MSSQPLQTSGDPSNPPWTDTVFMKPLSYTYQHPHAHQQLPQFFGCLQSPRPSEYRSAEYPCSLSLPQPVLQRSSTTIPLGHCGKLPLSEIISCHWSRTMQRIRNRWTGPARDTRPQGEVQVTVDTAPARSTVSVNSSIAHAAATGINYGQNTDEIDEVVVDRLWDEDFQPSGPDDDASQDSRSRRSSLTSTTGHNDQDSHRGSPRIHHQHQSPGIRAHFRVLTTLGSRLRTTIVQFFSAKFDDEVTEELYQQEVWSQSKRVCLWSSIFFIFNWVLGVIFVQTPVVLADKIFYYAVTPVLTIPLVLMSIFNVPRNHSFLYQMYLGVSTWSWSFYQILFVTLCGYYNHQGSQFTCGSKDLLSTFYYTSALQSIALFGAHLKRLSALIGALVFLIVSSCLITPLPFGWIRNILNFVIYQAFLLYIHYEREMSARKLYTLRLQMKSQVQQTQQAQLNERKAADSKRRLTSYVFHEVRVPLNTALLAVQNMGASGNIGKDQEVEFNALEGSLSMMSKVLNDVLDFNRMDSGRFESLSKPFAFHQVIRSLLLPLRLATDARDLELETDLDMSIDDVARRKEYEVKGESYETIDRRLQDEPSGDYTCGIVLGDEIRLRQIITNLASNACKFTPAGGRLRITTQLMIPRPCSHHYQGPRSDYHTRQTELPVSLAYTHLNCSNAANIPEQIVVRIEVSDTGSGIDPKEMAKSKLFSDFNQTEQGRQQGGKGTGLGLALVRQIVKLSGGRLGIRSKVGVGSTFWVELPIGIGFRIFNDKDGTSSSPMQLSAPDSSINPCVTVPDTKRAPKVAVNAPPCLRSSSALHGLMEQGGSVELVLPRYNSYAAIPTRTLGDASTGTDYPHLAAEPELYNLSRNSFDLANKSASTVLQNAVTKFCDEIAPGSVKSKIDQPPTPKVPESPCSRGEVLVVDDDQLTRTLMGRLLKRIGYTVITAENGRTALDILLSPPALGTESEGNDGRSTAPKAGHQFLVVFMDNQMPVMSGLEAVTILRSRGRRDFIVGVTGNALPSDQREYLTAGVDHVLTKPVLERNLQRMLNLATERRKPWAEPRE